MKRSFILLSVLVWGFSEPVVFSQNAGDYSDGSHMGRVLGPRASPTTLQEQQDLPQGPAVVDMCPPVQNRTGQRISNFEHMGNAFKNPWTMDPKDLLTHDWARNDWSPIKESLKNTEKKMLECKGENFQPWHRNAIEHLCDNANSDKIGTVLQKGILLDGSHVRTLPTEKPAYWATPGRDFFLDRLQDTYLNASMPVYISHYTKDGAWAMILDLSGKTYGYVPANRVAKITPEQISRMMKKSVGVLVKDQLVLQSLNSKNRLESLDPVTCIGHGGLGQKVFIQEANPKKEYVDIIMPNGKNKDGFVVFETVRLKKNAIITRPLSMTKESLKGIFSQLFGDYGWGGAYKNRDCSALMQDFFSLLGCSLTRNSGDQKTDTLCSEKIVLTGTAAEKERIILEKGIPYQTILYKQGHVALYVGKNKEGNAVIVHALYSINAKKKGQEFGYIIGKILTSTLHFDRDLLADADPETSFFADQLSDMLLVQLP